MQSMNSAKVVLWRYKKKKNGEAQIYIQITEDRKTRLVNTTLSAKEEDWDDDASRFKTRYRRAEDRAKIEMHIINNEIINKKLNEVNSLIKEYSLEDKLYSAQQIKNDILRSKKINTLSVFDYLDTVIVSQRRMGKIGTSDSYKTLKNSLNTFITSENIPKLYFRDITPYFLQKYEEDFRARGCQDTGISFYLRTLRAAYNRAVQDGVIKKVNYPFDQYKISKFSTQTVKRALKKSDILSIERLEIIETDRSFHSRNYFLFSYYNRGINFSDIASLKWENLHDNRLSYKRLKTGKNYTMELLEPAVRIIKFYQENYFRGDNSYIFPILDNTVHNTPTSIKNRIHKVLGQTNKDLKELGNRACLSIPLTTYVARHSFATVLKQSGASISVIKESLGHDNARTTEIYLDSFGNDILDDACKALL